MNKIIHKLFPTPVFQFKVNNFENLNKQLSDYIYELKKNDEKRNTKIKCKWLALSKF